MIRRPDEQPRLTAVGGNHKELFRTPGPRLRLARAAIRQKRDPPTIGRPARHEVAVLPGRELSRIARPELHRGAAVDRRHPEV